MSIFRHLRRRGLTAAAVAFVASCDGGRSATEPPPGPGRPPADPGSFTAAAASAQGIRLTWTAADGADGYILERRAAEGPFVRLLTAPRAATAHLDEGLSPATEYTYRIRSVSGAGASAGRQASASTMALPDPGVPLGVYALRTIDGSALPGVLFDGRVDDDEAPFHLRLEVLDGSLAVAAGGRYEHRLTVAAYVDGAPDPAGPTRWNDNGAVEPLGAALRFVSHHIQHVAFEGAYAGGQLDVAQDLLRHFHDVGRVAHFSYGP